MRLFSLLLATTAAPAAPPPDAKYVALENCSAQFARSFSVRSRESATVIADAAIGACATQEHEFAVDVFGAFPVDRTGNIDARATFEFRLSRLHRKLIAVVLDERIKQGI